MYHIAGRKPAFRHARRSRVLVGYPFLKFDLAHRSRVLVGYLFRKFDLARRLRVLVGYSFFESVLTRRLRAQVPRSCLLLGAGLLLSGAYTRADLGEPLTLAAAEAFALAEEPGQRALRAEADAQRQQARIAAQLPDPELRLAINNYPIESGGFSTEGMTNAQLGLRQAFPPGDRRSMSERQLRSLAEERDYRATSRGRDVVTATRLAWLEVYYRDQARRTIVESRPFFEDLVQSTRSLYSVGRKSQQDVLRAELELSRLEDRLIEADRQRAGARARLGRWVGDAAARPIAATLPAWDRLPPLEDLQQALRSHPALMAADASVEASDAGIGVARARQKPGWMLDLSYSYRDGSLPAGTPRSDFVSIGVTVGLPFFRKRSVDSTLSAALADKRAAAASKEALRRDLFSRLEAEYSQWRDLTRRLELYRRVILAQTEDQVNAAQLAYQNDVADFADLMQANIEQLDTRIDYIRLQVVRARSYAAIANLGGLSQ